MISEVRSGAATVRFHDEYCDKETRQTMMKINQIVSRAYQRRMSVPAAETEK